MPSYTSGVATWAGFDSWIFRIYGSFGGCYAPEPTKSLTTKQLYWDSYEIRFHYPAEHPLNTTQYALEMQIFSKDYFNYALLCRAHYAAVSILFELDDASAPNPFFDWQANYTAG